MMNATVRPVKSEDIQNVLILSKRLEADSFPCSYWGLVEGDVSQMIKAPQQKTVITLIENSLAGIGTISQGGQYQSHLVEISVAISPDYRRRGVAKNLVAHLEETAKGIGIELIKALIWIKNMPSRSLFESLGYEHWTTLYAEFKSPEFGEIDDCVYYKRINFQKIKT